MSKEDRQAKSARVKMLIAFGAMAITFVLSLATTHFFQAAGDSSFLKAETEKKCADYGSQGCQNVLQHRSTAADEMAVEVAAWQAVIGVIGIPLLLLTFWKGNRAAPRCS